MGLVLTQRKKRHMKLGKSKIFNIFSGIFVQRNIKLRILKIDHILVISSQNNNPLDEIGIGF